MEKCRVWDLRSGSVRIIQPRVYIYLYIRRDSTIYTIAL